MKALASLVLLLGLAACSGSGGGGGDGDAAGSTPDRGRPTTSAPSTDPTSAPAPPTAAGLADTDVCARVRRGIDAFNLSDLERTVATFAGAVGPAEDLARDQPSDETRTLLEAVRYYAALPADEYLEANESSPEFARYKDFTLTECAYVAPALPTTDPAIPA